LSLNFSSAEERERLERERLTRGNARRAAQNCAAQNSEELLTPKARTRYRSGNRVMTDMVTGARPIHSSPSRTVRTEAKAPG
jgi:hypothetical protein